MTGDVGDLMEIERLAKSTGIVQVVSEQLLTRRTSSE